MYFVIEMVNFSHLKMTEKLKLVSLHCKFLYNYLCFHHSIKNKKKTREKREMKIRAKYI